MHIFFLSFYRLLMDLFKLKHINCIIFTFLHIQRQQIAAKSQSLQCFYPALIFAFSHASSILFTYKILLRWLLNDLVLFFGQNYRISHHNYLLSFEGSTFLILNLKTLAQRFQVCYAQKHMRETWDCSFKKTDTLRVFNWSFSILFQGQMIQF